MSLLISCLLEGYRARRFSPLDVVEEALSSIAHTPDRGVWITLLPREQVLDYARALAERDPASLPLYGVPFAIKDNIDLAGIPTTAGCPDYAYTPTESAFVVRLLIESGAIPVGKTNLDQFATGLVGVRSPYGACRNSFDAAYISGGSSSGSAVAVATGLVSFSLGTDTAGSGRVPAAFNNIVGLKPTCGALSTRGVVPACRSLDCVSIFALTADDAARVFDVAAVFDPDDPYAKEVAPPLQAQRSQTQSTQPAQPRPPASPPAQAQSPRAHPAPSPPTFRFGVPHPRHLEFFNDSHYPRLFTEAITRLESLGGQRVEIDFEPFLAAARLLYEGPWVSERYCAVGDFLDRRPESVHAVTLQIISGGRTPTAVDAFRSQHRLMELRRAAEKAWDSIDVLVTPTAGTIYRIDAVESDPIKLNSNLGYYTNFVNLLDLAAVAVPTGFRPDGLPFGVTLVGRAGADASLLALADRLHRSWPAKLGALSVELLASPVFSDAPFVSTTTSSTPTTAISDAANPRDGAAPIDVADPSGDTTSPSVGVNRSATTLPNDPIPVVVCGAHMEGLPLNHQLTSRDGILVSRTRTAPTYRFFALPGGPPHRPGLVRVATGGAAIEVEVWSVPSAHFGSFVAGIPAPLGIGKVELEDGTQVCGFVCESYAVANATDITSLGSWRRYLT